MLTRRGKLHCITKEYVVKRLRGECIPAPLTQAKIAYAFGRDDDINKIFELFIKGILDDYHMINNGTSEI